VLAEAHALLSQLAPLKAGWGMHSHSFREKLWIDHRACEGVHSQEGVLRRGPRRYSTIMDEKCATRSIVMIGTTCQACDRIVADGK
jgi:hypothetical protein